MVTASTTENTPTARTHGEHPTGQTYRLTARHEERR